MSADLSETVTRSLLEDIEPERSDDGTSLAHAAWMMDNLPDDPIKRSRWVGYAQALLVIHEAISLIDLRDATRPT